jgi:RNA polymerase sigma factor (sigma-70 family)
MRFKAMANNDSLAEMDDKDLIFAIMCKDEDRDSAIEAFGEFHKRHSKFLYYTALKQFGNTLTSHEIKESVNEALMILWRDAYQYVEGKSKPTTWLYKIAKNKAIDIIRGKKRVLEVPAGIDYMDFWDKHRDELPEDFSEPEKRKSHPLMNQAKEVINSLTEIEKEVIIACINYNCLEIGDPEVYRELANRFGKTVGNIKQIKFRAKKKIEKFRDQEAPEYLGD